MSETIKLSFDDGYKNIELNGNPDKIIRINPTDTQFINRISGFDEKYENIRSRYGDIDMNSINDLQNLDENNPDFEKLKLAADSVDKLDMAVKDLINEIFGYDISLIVFGTDSCLSPAGGQPIFMNFMQCIFAYINECSVEKERNHRRNLIPMRHSAIPLLVKQNDRCIA